jgi:hypothetical protein
MNVEIGTVAAQFPEKEYLFRILVNGSLQCVPEWIIIYLKGLESLIVIILLKFRTDHHVFSAPVQFRV